jgi:hypothetical protein
MVVWVTIITQWKGDGPEVKRVGRAGGGHSRKRVSRMCNNQPDKERGVSGSDIGIGRRLAAEQSLAHSFRRPTLTSVFCQWFQTNHA